MAITEAKCPSCGAPVHITGVNQVCKCPSCGNEFIVHEDKTVNTNNFSVTQNIQKTIYGNERAEAEDYIRNADIFFNLGETLSAEKAYRKAIELNPGDYRGWFGLARIYSANFTDSSSDSEVIAYLKKAKAVATPNEIKIMKNESEPYFAMKREMRRKQEELRRKQEAEKQEMARRSAIAAQFQRQQEIESQKKAKKSCLIKLIILIIVVAGAIVGIVLGVRSIPTFDTTTNADGSITITDRNEPIDGVIPSTIDGKVVTGIGDNALEDSDFSTLILPDTITYIGERAFANCENLTDVFIPASVTFIGEDAFIDCPNLRTIRCEAPYEPDGWAYCWDRKTDHFIFSDTFFDIEWGASRTVNGNESESVPQNAEAEIAEGRKYSCAE